MIRDEIKLEACVESLEEAQEAEKKGAHQIELCANLSVGGTTPKRDLIKAAKTTLRLKIKVMIRPRGGNFVYSIPELEEMKQSILFCKSLGIEGVVFGILHADNTVNLDQTTVLARLAKPMEVTFHRAIDDTPDIMEAIDQLMTIPSVDAVLSAGKAATAAEGAKTLKRMVFKSKGKLSIIPGGAVTKGNVAQLHQEVGASEYHGTKIVGVLNR